MNTRAVAALTGFLLLYGALVAYIGWNGWMFLSSVGGSPPAIIYWLLLGLLSLGYILGRLGESTALRPLAGPLKIAGSYWIGLFQYSLLLLPVAGLAGLVLKLAGMPQSVYLVGTGTAVAAFLLILLVVGTRNAWSPVIRHYDISIPKIAGERKTLTIAMASDLHLGTVIGNRHIARLVKKVNDIAPDIILLPGDILDDDLAPFLRKGMASTLGQLKAPLGVYAVTGNHEYIGGKVPQFVEAMREIGIPVLMDEAVVIEDSFVVLGRKDKASGGFKGGGRKTVAELTESLPREMPVIMLDHQPSDLDAAQAAGIDLSLSGHTHRGQMAPNHWITRRMFELDWGYKQKGSLHAVVSSGFGFWGPPLRLGSRSEVVELKVTFGE
ncbi:metallophosphoesterase [Paenibacillus sp. CAU 1782]